MAPPSIVRVVELWVVETVPLACTRFRGTNTTEPIPEEIPGLSSSVAVVASTTAEMTELPNKLPVPFGPE